MREWVIPPELCSAFVADMERVIYVYCKAYDPLNPVICIDEMPKQLIQEKRNSFVDDHGIQYYDSEYVRAGTTNVFMAVEPLAGKRYAQVIDTKTRIDFANFVKYVCEHYKDANKITIVCDNLVTHDYASFYEAFDPQTASLMMSKIDIVHTPKHGSWLDMAEIELSVLSKQCLSGRIGSVGELKEALDAWLKERNEKAVKIDWHFTTENARIKLRRLYPIYRSV